MRGTSEEAPVREDLALDILVMDVRQRGEVRGVVQSSAPEIRLFLDRRPDLSQSILTLLPSRTNPEGQGPLRY